VIQERYKVEKISVIANGVKEKNYIQNHNYEYDLVSVSRLVSWKRIELLISLSIKENLSLVVIGDGPERDRLFQQTQNGRNRIIFTGNLRSEGVHDYLKKSRVFALLSEYEGMSFSLLEAMMAGKRILTSDISGNNEVLGKSIFAKRVNPLDFESLVKAALELLPDTKENFSRERDAHAWAKDNFSESLQIEKMIRYCPGNSHD
jgi:glycosyltransferase involved in cell wall biosynthesis